MDELREAFNAAYEEAEKEEVIEEPQEAEPEEAVVTEKEEPAEEAPIQEAPIEQAPVEEAPVEEAPVAKDDKVPASWSLTAKQAWDKVPEPARKEILKREHEVSTVLNQSAQARRAAETLNRTLEPYKQGLIAAGVENPFNAIDTLLRTEAVLRGGTSVEKGNMIARLIQQYSVDIPTLDSVLSGSQPSQETDKFEKMLNEKLAPVNSFLAQQHNFAQQQQYEMQNNAAQSIQQFSQEAEFLAEVRNDMADLLDMAANRNQELTLQQAYDKACALHPEVSKIMAQRAKEQQIMGNQQDIQRKKTAAASINGKQGGDGGQADVSLRGMLSDAWDSQLQG